MTMTRTALYLKLLLIFLVSFFLNPRPTHAIGYAEDTLPSFSDFNKSVQGGEGGVLRGVYVSHVLALPVVQQPANSPYYVSNHNGEVTQFSIASQHGNIGLLAHNTLSGRFFSQLRVGQEVRLVYDDGSVEYFVVAQLLHFQALQPDSVSSSFRNLDGNETLTAGQMFGRAYGGERSAVFQTCIEADGKPSWGRLFVIAVPKE
ncbi:MAG: hypothetical protein ACXW4E_05940 [Anaerolineales bacterium]